mmetsp:Transcript_32113/g.31433  ORF Transcript_32113/g.31433 Transcript_32113/m.31433 type:complete len:84 (+) Transcript_32113:1740-1991(+)
MLFDKYDGNKNGKLSTEEIAAAILKDMKIKLEDDEVLVIKEFIKNKYRSNEIRRLEFVELFQTVFDRKDVDPDQAKSSLQTLK